MSIDPYYARPEVALVTGPVEYGALRDEWIDLWERTPEAGVFQRPEWLIPWWRHFGSGKVMRVVLIRCEGRLVGLLPLSILRQPDNSRELQLIGTGNTDRLDAIIDPAYRDTVVQAISHWLESDIGDWDRCLFAQLPADSALLRLRTSDSLVRTISPAEPCPVLQVTDHAAVGVHASPRRYAYYRRRAEREGARFIESSHADFDRLLDGLFALHAARWRERDQPGALADVAVQAFLRHACAELRVAGMLRLIGLAHHDRLVGLYLAFSARGRCSAYIGGFDPEYNRLNPGTVLIGRLVEQTGKEGGVLDFLRGREPYKYDWGAADEELWTCTLTRRT